MKSALSIIFGVAAVAFVAAPLTSFAEAEPLPAR